MKSTQYKFIASIIILSSFFYMTGNTAHGAMDYGNINCIACSNPTYTPPVVVSEADVPTVNDAPPPVDDGLEDEFPVGNSYFSDFPEESVDETDSSNPSGYSTTYAWGVVSDGVWPGGDKTTPNTGLWALEKVRTSVSMKGDFFGQNRLWDKKYKSYKIKWNSNLVDLTPDGNLKIVISKKYLPLGTPSFWSSQGFPESGTGQPEDEIINTIVPVNQGGLDVDISNADIGHYLLEITPIDNILFFTAIEISDSSQNTIQPKFLSLEASAPWQKNSDSTIKFTAENVTGGAFFELLPPTGSPLSLGDTLVDQLSGTTTEQTYRVPSFRFSQVPAGTGYKIRVKNSFGTATLTSEPFEIKEKTAASETIQVQTYSLWYKNRPQTITIPRIGKTVSIPLVITLQFPSGKSKNLGITSGSSFNVGLSGLYDVPAGSGYVITAKSYSRNIAGTSTPFEIRDAASAGTNKATSSTTTLGALVVSSLQDIKNVIKGLWTK